jgi:hypothetical protein
MVRTSHLVFALLLAASASSISTGEVYNFTSGLLIGLESNAKAPGPCYKAISGLTGDFEAIASDISRITQGDEAAVMQLLTDVTGTKRDVQAFNGTCDFTSLEAQIKVLLSPAGAKIISANYLKHVFSINKDLATVKDCSANYYSCGKASGEIIRDLVGWSLNTPHGLGASNKNTLEAFLTGLIKGLEANGEDECTQSLSDLTSDISDLLANIEQVIKGDSSALISIVMKLKKLKDSLKDINSCDFSGFVQKIESLFESNGYQQLIMNYLKNSKQIMADLAGIEACSTNLSQCGSDLGQVIRLLLNWGL